MCSRIVSKIVALSWFPLSLCFFFIPSHIFKNNSATAIPPFLPFCCCSVNCVVLIIPAAGTFRWRVMTSWLWANQEELTSCKLIQGNRKNSLSNINFYLEASFLSIQKYSFILIALKTKHSFFSIFTSQTNYIVSTRQLQCCWSLLNETQHSFHVLVDHCSNCADFLPRATTGWKAACSS